MNVRYAQAQEGDSRAVRTIVEGLRPRLTRMAGYYARCTGEDADDLLQEAWVGLLEALAHVDPKIGNSEQFLIQHARWRLLDAVKRARVRRCVSLNELFLGPSVPCGMEAAMEGVAFAAFLRRLNATQQKVLKCLLSGLTWREAGEVLGCTSANIAYHVRQIREKYARWCQGSSQVMDRRETFSSLQQSNID